MLTNDWSVLSHPLFLSNLHIVILEALLLHKRVIMNHQQVLLDMKIFYKYII